MASPFTLLFIGLRKSPNMLSPYIPMILCMIFILLHLFTLLIQILLRYVIKHFFMNKGSIIEMGNHIELLEQNGFYADLYNSQFTGANLNKEVG